MEAPARSRRAAEKGQSFVGLLIALVLVAALVVIALRGGIIGAEPGRRPLDRKKQAQEVVCEMNRKQIEQQLAMRSALGPSQQAPDAGMPGEAAGLPRCPAGGSYSIGGGRVTCSIHGPFRGGSEPGGTGGSQ